MYLGFETSRIVASEVQPLWFPLYISAEEVTRSIILSNFSELMGQVSQETQQGGFIIVSGHAFLSLALLVSNYILLTILFGEYIHLQSCYVLTTKILVVFIIFAFLCLFYTDIYIERERE